MKWGSCEVESSVDYSNTLDNYGVIVDRWPVSGKIMINLPLGNDDLLAQFNKFVHELNVKISEQE
jgi:hypothetical protein